MSGIKMQRVRKIVAMLCALFVFESTLSVAFYRGITHDVPGANDFYVPWRASQALVREGLNPYSPEVTRQIQIGMFGRERAPGEHSFAFAYPLYTALLLAPLIWLPYDAAQAVWYALLLPLLLVTGMVALRNLHISPSRPALLGIAVWMIFFYPAARSLILGQLALVVCASVVLAWWCVRQSMDTLAGVLLALTTIKPQMVFLILPVALWWAWQQRRRRLLVGFGLTFGALVVGSLLMQPSWPLDFIETARAYSGYFDSQSPLQILVGNDALALGLSLVAVMAWLVTVAYTSARGWHGLMRLFMWGIVITQLVAVHTATTNQIMLMLPIFYVLRSSPALKWWAALGAFLVVPWGVFLLTKQGNVESPLALLPLGIGVAAWWFADEWMRLRHAPSRELAT